MDCTNTGRELSLEAARAEIESKVFTVIHFRVSGKQLETAAQTIERSRNNYCSVSVMLGNTAKITSGFEITEGQRV